MLAPTEQLIAAVADELEMSEEVVVHDSLRAFLEDLKQIEAQLFDIHGRYGVKSIAELAPRSIRPELWKRLIPWRDYQGLDHLEYRRTRLLHLIEILGSPLSTSSHCSGLPKSNSATSSSKPCPQTSTNFGSYWLTPVSSMCGIP